VIRNSKFKRYQSSLGGHRHQHRREQNFKRYRKYIVNSIRNNALLPLFYVCGKFNNNVDVNLKFKLNGNTFEVSNRDALNYLREDSVKAFILSDLVCSIIKDKEPKIEDLQKLADEFFGRVNESSASIIKNELNNINKCINNLL